MRKTIVAGNWKMNKNLEEAMALFLTINKKAKKSDDLKKVLIFPPFLFLYPLNALSKPEYIGLGAQNIASEAEGAYTGEVSASMVKSIGIEYTLIGHSERRQIFGRLECRAGI